METRPVGSKYWRCSVCGAKYATREDAQAHVCPGTGTPTYIEGTEGAETPVAQKK